MLAHLNRCPQCYRHWLEAAAFVEASRPAAQPEPRRSRDSFWLRITAWLSPQTIALPLATAAIMLGVGTVLLLSQNGLERSMDDAYAGFATRNPGALAQAMSDFPLPWADAKNLGFADATVSPPAEAFAAGLWQGRTALGGTSSAGMPPPVGKDGERNWPATDWAPYHALGRWIAMGWGLAGSDSPAANWADQRRILGEIAAELRARGSGDDRAPLAVAAIGRLDRAIEGLERKPDQIAQADLKRILALTIQQLFP
jgi:hypothetical protein